MITPKGFTLIELLIVIVIISILAATIYVAVDPNKRFGDARDSRRRAETVSILNAVLTYEIDNNGTLPSGVSATSKQLGTAATGCDTTCVAGSTAAACLDLTSSLVDKYLSGIPTDPKSGTAATTLYYIKQSASGRILVGACSPENVASISVSR